MKCRRVKNIFEIILVLEKSLFSPSNNQPNIVRVQRLTFRSGAHPHKMKTKKLCSTKKK
jgi:hypothetical protein